MWAGHKSVSTLGKREQTTQAEPVKRMHVSGCRERDSEDKPLWQGMMCSIEPPHTNGCCAIQETLEFCQVTHCRINCALSSTHPGLDNL